MAPSRDRTIARFVAGIALPAVIVIGGAIAAVVVSLDQMVDAVNTTELSLTKQSAEAAVASAVRRISESVGDYAQWDDAVTKLAGVPDPDFVSENLAGSTASPVFFDTAYLIDQHDKDVLGFHAGEATTVASKDALGPSIASMLAQLPTDGRTFETRGGIARGMWGDFVVAAAPIVPSSADLPVNPAETRFLVIAKAFDEAAIKKLGVDYVISGLSLAAADVASATDIRLTDFDGRVIGSLSWSPRHVGSSAKARVSPLALSMLILLGLTTLALATLAVTGLVRLKRAQQSAEHAATHDMLTGLPNRSSLVERLQKAILTKRWSGTAVAIAYLDLDGFKEVNDTYGHEIGDALLRKVATAFQRIAGDSLLVRLGGDEFAVVVEGPNSTAIAADVGGRLVDFFDDRLLIDGRVITLSTSVGIVTLDTIGISVDELLRRADVAMYQAKHLGRDRVCIYDRSLDDVRLRRIGIAADLRRALHTGGLVLAYQPIVDAATRKTVGIEALLRWPNPPAGPLGPAEFIPIAEESDLIDEIGLWTLRRACTDALAWPGIKVAVNASPAQFRSRDFASDVATVLREVGFPAERLEVEVTETYLVAHPEQARAIIDALRALGVAVALDDFGTGYSSIGYLRRFAFDKLKMDGTLITNIESDSHARDLVQATVHLGLALGLTVTAEGVETEAQAIILRAAGCHSYQGFFFGKPGSALAISTRISAEQPSLAMTA